MLIQHLAEVGEGSGQPTEPQHTPTTASPSHIVPIPTVASSSQPKKTQKHKKTKRKATEISQSSRPTTFIADETVHEERKDRVERAATTAASLDAEFERLSKQSHEPPLSRVNTLGSGEDNMQLMEMMKLYTKLSKRVKRLEKKRKSRTLQLKMRFFKVRIESSAEKSLGDQEDASNQERNGQDKGISFVQDAEIQGRYGHDIKINTGSTSITTASINITIAEPVTTVSTPITTASVSISTIEPNHELAERLQAEEQRALSIEESFEEVQKDFDKTMSWVNLFVPMDKEVVKGSRKKAKSSRKEAVSKKRARKRLDEESIKRQKLEDDAEKEELRACLEIVQHDDSAIIRSDGSTRYYKIFSAMLDDFDRQDVLDLYRLKMRYGKNQQDYTLISWRLYDSCGIYLLLMDTGMSIHMLVEKEYHLTQKMLSRMLSGRLEVDHECEMANELIRYIKSQYKKWRNDWIHPPGEDKTFNQET
nr:hypothetical protein [Tanacetum cinerariifolium]GEZ41395.1 hypothetical protein [Tanacetum cinerariifolium]